jgi:hypothetical protein
MTTSIANAEVEQLRAEVVRLRRENEALRRELTAADEREDAKEPPNSPTVLELMPHDMRCAVLECVGGDEWVRAVPIVSRGLRDLCARKEMRDAVRRWAMGVFKKGMDLYHGHSGAVVDTEAGEALIMRAAKAGLRSARAFWHYRWAQNRVGGEERGAVFAKAITLLEAEIAGSASETEASGGPCVHATSMLGHCYFYGRGVEKDGARALELYHHAVEVDKNQDAMFQLAFAYRHGHFGQVRDYERALSLYKRGAELGDYECRYSLGRIYRYGVCGVEVDLKQALYWMEKANEQRGGELTREIEEIREMMRTNSIQD